MIAGQPFWKWKTAAVVALSLVFPALAFSSIQSKDGEKPAAPVHNGSGKGFHIAVTGFAFSRPALQLRETVNEVFEVLADPGLQHERELRRLILRQLIRDRLDPVQMAKKALGPDWKKGTPGQRSRFVELFQQLLGRAYLGMVETYTHGGLHYLGESVRSPYALVKTRVRTASRTLAIDYRLVHKHGEWRVYDVLVDGVSLVDNFRRQFHSILQDTSFEGLLHRLENQLG